MYAHGCLWIFEWPTQLGFYIPVWFIAKHKLWQYSTLVFLFSVDLMLLFNWLKNIQSISSWIWIRYCISAVTYNTILLLAELSSAGDFTSRV